MQKPAFYGFTHIFIDFEELYLIADIANVKLLERFISLQGTMM